MLEYNISNHARKMLVIYYILTFLAFFYAAAIYITAAPDLLSRLIPDHQNAYTYLYLTFTWGLLGTGIFLCAHKKINQKNLLYWLGFLICGLTYAIFLTERSTYGDVNDYILGAINISNGEPFHARYIYPPLWATCLQPLASFGHDKMEFFCLALNFLSFMLFYYLLHRILRHYGFSPNLAAIIQTLFLVINTPVLRTFCYVQVNFHLINLVLLGMLCYPHHKLVSAIFFSLAFHLKLSPGIFVLLFLLQRDWKWIIYFTTATLGVILLTSLANDVSYYSSFVENISQKTSGAGFCLRQNSIDSFIKASSCMLGLNLGAAKYLIISAKTALLFISMIILSRSIRKQSFYTQPGSYVIVHNGFVAISFLMITISPIIWEHHPVFVIPAFIILASNLKSIGEWIAYLVSYFLIFIVPTFDFFPFSYHRLLGLIICYFLLWKIAREAKPQYGLLQKANQWAESLVGSKMRYHKTTGAVHGKSG